MLVDLPRLTSQGASAVDTASETQEASAMSDSAAEDAPSDEELTRKVG